jgi:hypothetical protein
MRYLRRRMPDDRPHHFTIRNAPKQIVRGVPQTMRRDPPLGRARRARRVKHVSQG